MLLVWGVQNRGPQPFLHHGLMLDNIFTLWFYACARSRVVHAHHGTVAAYYAEQSWCV